MLVSETMIKFQNIYVHTLDTAFDFTFVMLYDRRTFMLYDRRTINQ